RPRHPDIQQIPAVVLNYYDPADGAFHEARTQPIPIDVKAVKIISGSNISTATTPNPTQPASQPEKKRKQRLPQGIHANFSGPELLENQRPPAQIVLSTPALILLTLPPAFFLLNLGIAGLLWLRNRNPARISKRRAYQQLKQKFSSSSDPHELYKELQHFLATLLDLPPGSVISANNIEAKLKQSNVDPQLIHHLQHLLQQWNDLNFSGTPTENTLDQLRRQTMETTEKLWRNLE
ncbi:MAG: hypothetical protein D6820_03545, partial [Lentisphaerae bacterium]